MNESNFVNNGYSVMNISAYGTRMDTDTLKNVASHWLYATVGIYIALLLMNTMDMEYPAVLGTPLILISSAGVLVTQAMDLLRRLPITLECGGTHLPIMVNYINRNIRFAPRRGEVKPLQVFRDKYRCREIRVDGRKAYKLTGTPSSDMKAFIKGHGPKVGTLVFYVAKISFVYVCNTDGDDQIGEVLEHFSQEKIVHIQSDTAEILR